MKASVLGDRTLFVFVAPPSMEELERRLRGRGTETEDKILKRLHNAKAEMDKSKVCKHTCPGCSPAALACTTMYVGVCICVTCDSKGIECSTFTAVMLGNWEWLQYSWLHCMVPSLELH